MTPSELIVELEATIDAKRKELKRFERSLSALKETDGANETSSPHSSESVNPHQFEGTKPNKAVVIYLARRQSAMLDDICEALLRGGCRMGTYPKRTIKLVVVNSPRTFELTGDMKNPLVTLRNR